MGSRRFDGVESGAKSMREKFDITKFAFPLPVPELLVAMHLRFFVCRCGSSYQMFNSRKQLASSHDLGWVEAIRSEKYPRERCISDTFASSASFLGNCVHLPMVDQVS